MIIKDHHAPIATAPRDGTMIVVAHDDVGEFVMVWDPEGANDFFAPGDVGIWVATDGSFTWKDTDGVCPSPWRPCGPRSVN